ncbi:hypothetical protein C8A00DRAFT_37491 [Chaetomidium leptoderma]|uniref:Retrovirus-related Pol polyprotein from transposon TNT 1-94-like beta-barrel domain-containing protein n=1 Tax=Chaetomidium leptoderma TaxID=669021 RepID=A0AAN6VFJ8_9PEZI|nr:hypothetical protein C8A00DRAFT_37491 [Chaetomidium leptoderma]
MAKNDATTPLDPQGLCPDWVWTTTPKKLPHPAMYDSKTMGWHVAKNREWFTSYTPKQSTVYQRHWQGKPECAMAMFGIGTVELPVRLDPADPTKTGTLVLENVLHVPDAKFNIVCHEKVNEARRLCLDNKAEGFPQGKVEGADGGKTLAYFRDIHYPGGPTHPHPVSWTPLPGGFQVNPRLVELAHAPAGRALGPSTFEDLLQTGCQRAEWVTWDESTE